MSQVWICADSGPEGAESYSPGPAARSAATRGRAPGSEPLDSFALKGRDHGAAVTEVSPLQGEAVGELETRGSHCVAALLVRPRAIRLRPFGAGTSAV